MAALSVVEGCCIADSAGVYGGYVLVRVSAPADAALAVEQNTSAAAFQAPTCAEASERSLDFVLSETGTLSALACRSGISAPLVSQTYRVKAAATGALLHCGVAYTECLQLECV